MWRSTCTFTFTTEIRYNVYLYTCICMESYKWVIFVCVCVCSIGSRRVGCGGCDEVRWQHSQGVCYLCFHCHLLCCFLLHSQWLHSIMVSSSIVPLTLFVHQRLCDHWYSWAADLIVAPLLFMVVYLNWGLLVLQWELCIRIDSALKWGQFLSISWPVLYNGALVSTQDVCVVLTAQTSS